jgi:peptidyl-prolyl cis-trans isomerase B (cyclophilin B)
MHGDAQYLDGEYAAFGMLIDGQDVLDRIAQVRTDWSDRPLKDQKIRSITVDTQGVDYPEPEKC